tara:strand:+ start:773 stop:943 length:171 start_codon:yes stop_codon:yes gene_type:complete
MPLPFFCAVCDEPIVPSRNRKHNLIHDKCLDNYLKDFNVNTTKEYNKSTTTNKIKK